MDDDFLVMQVGPLGQMSTSPARCRNPEARTAEGPHLKSPPIMEGLASRAMARPMSAKMARLNASRPVPALK
eukprot:3095141-Heterocapsa_arctica.AAC.1